MKFNAINELIERCDRANHRIAMEASSLTVDVNGQSMTVIPITDKFIEDAHLPEVTSPIWFKNGRIPTDDGLFSPVIFGETLEERKLNHAYINLKRKFFHPYIYEIITSLNRKIATVASGQGAWIVSATGDLEQITDKDDKRYDEDNTGLAWLIDNFKKIKFHQTDSDKNKDKIRLLNSLKDDQIFITKCIVIPIFYRDVDYSSGSKAVPVVNTWYNSLITNTNSFDNDLLSVTKHLTLFNIQKTLVMIRQFGQSLIEKKKGAFQKSILGKSVDFGGRGVISVPSLDGCDVPNDCIVDITHSGIPLSYCITTGYPFMIKWITEFFEDMFRNKKHVPVYRKKKGKDEPSVEYVEIEDQTEIFTRDYIDSKLEMYKSTYGPERFETIKVRCKDGSEHDLYFDGKGYGAKPNSNMKNDSADRPLTWTDVIYLAAVETLSDKHAYITRDPLIDYFGIFPSRVAVLSTIKTTPMIVNGKVYPHYPVIDLSLTPQEISTQFIDTISISNLYLDAIGGDYDGDTVSLKLVFSIEANQEAEELLNNVKHYISIQGNLVRVLGNEAYLTFYNMTRRE